MIFEESEHYNIKALLRYLLTTVAAIAVWRIASEAGAILVSLFVIVSVLRNKSIDLLFGALFISYTFVANYLILPRNGISIIIVRVTLVLLTVLLVDKWTEYGRESSLLTPFWGIMVYLTWEAFVSFQGFSPIVSYLKLLFFISVFLAFFGVANAVNHSINTNAMLLRSAILAIIALVIIGSVLLVPFPALGQLTGEAAIEALQNGEGVSLFQGMTAQPQVMGLISAIMGTMLFADLAFSIKRWDKLYILLMLLCLFLIYMSSSRTGMGTLIVGFGSVVFFIMRGKGLVANWKGKLLMAINTLVVVGAIVICLMPSLSGKISRFVLKFSENSVESEISFERIVSSRQKLIDESIMNFKSKPILGNGFQVSSSMLDMERSGFLSYLTAPIEKGVWIYAIPEEGGIIGMALFCIWLFFLFRILILRKAYIGASVFFAFLTANFGEFTIFSMSYIGGFCWILTFSALCLDLQRIKTETPEISKQSLQINDNMYCIVESIRSHGM